MSPRRTSTGSHSRSLPLNLEAWRSARNESSLIAELQSDRQTATTAGIQGTPTLTFQGPRGKAQTPETVPSYDQLQQASSQSHDGPLTRATAGCLRALHRAAPELA